MDTLRIISKKKFYEIFDVADRMTIVTQIETYQAALELQRKLAKLKQDVASYSMPSTRKISPAIKNQVGSEEYIKPPKNDEVY